MRCMKTIVWTCAFAALALIGGLASGADDRSAQARPATQPASGVRDDAAAESLGWRLGTQAWTFRDRTLFETIDVARDLGLRYIECFPGQALSPEHSDVKFGVDLPAELQKALKERAASRKVALVSMGVVGFKNDEAECRKTFDFAKAMGFETISCEPDEDAADLLDRLAEEYEINLAIHDHPKPSHYWNPETVLKVVQGKSKRFGACADTGHWSRSSLVPVDCLKKLEGRIIESHFKDITDGVDQPWGTGAGDAKAMLAELHRQHFRGVILLEYETGEGRELESNAAKCVVFFDKTARELAAAPAAP